MLRALGEGKKNTGQILPGTLLVQQFEAEGNLLEGVDLLIRTFKRQNLGSLRVELRKTFSGEALAADAAPMHLMRDNGPHHFKLNAELIPGSTYQIVVSTSGTCGGRSVAVGWSEVNDRRLCLSIGMTELPSAALAGRLVYSEKAEMRLRTKQGAAVPDLSKPTCSVTDGTVIGLVSVVVPFYRTAALLPACLKSVAEQTYNFCEVILVNDASDEAMPSVEALLPEQPLTIISHKQNRGASATRNTGASKAVGEYLFFLDSDTVLKSSAFEELMQALHRSDAAFAYCNFTWGTNTVHGMPWNYEALKEKNFISTMSLLRREAFPGFDEGLKRHQDWDLWLTLAEKGHKGAWVNKVLFDSPVRDGSISTNGSISRNSSVRIVRKKHGI